MRLGGVMADDGARLRRGDCKLGWDGAAGARVDAGGTKLLFKGPGSLESTALTRQLGGGFLDGGGGVHVGHGGVEREERLTAGTRLLVKQGCGADRSMR